jgi:transcriptional regulator with XRE-family HTH domain
MENTKIDIGSKVKAYREACGWSQRQLGERADVSGQLIWLIERGGANPKLGTIERIAEALGVSPFDLMQ